MAKQRKSAAALYPPFKLEMTDGTIECNLTFANQLALETGAPELYEELLEIRRTPDEELTELKISKYIYISYVAECLASDNDERYGSFAEFLQFLPYDVDVIAAVLTHLNNPKKAQASATSS